jgi:hypothetical protein
MTVLCPARTKSCRRLDCIRSLPRCCTQRTGNTPVPHPRPLGSPPGTRARRESAPSRPLPEVRYASTARATGCSSRNVDYGQRCRASCCCAALWLCLTPPARQERAAKWGARVATVGQALTSCGSSRIERGEVCCIMSHSVAPDSTAYAFEDLAVLFLPEYTDSLRHDVGFRGDG